MIKKLLNFFKLVKKLLCLRVPKDTGGSHSVLEKDLHINYKEIEDKYKNAPSSVLTKIYKNE